MLQLLMPYFIKVHFEFKLGPFRNQIHSLGRQGVVQTVTLPKYDFQFD